MDIKEVAGFKMIVDTPMEQYRYETFYSKEPETIAWINDMQAGEVLYDVGANIGIYTLHAASRGVQVVAIEPVLENFNRLVQNVELNGFAKVIPIYSAIGWVAHDEGFSDLSIYSLESGASGSQIDKKDGIIVRAVPISPLTRIIEYIGMYPDYLKIDVDGQEKSILDSIYTPDNIWSSLLIEINPPYTMDMAQLFLERKFTTDNKYNTMTPHSRERRQREGITAENVVFTRIT